MQRSGMPRKLPQEGKAVLPTFQITAFSTGLKNHVMVMDLVKSNWFPSQRRAKVCVIHMCPGPKVAQQPASRYEIHSRLFSSPKDDSAWERNESLSKAGLLDKQYSTNDQIALRNFQSAGTERKLDFTKGTLASQNRKMISSIVFSHLIDEKKSKENGAMMPLTRANAQPPSPSLKPASARRSRVNIPGSLAVSPDRLGILTLPDERGLETEPLSTQANLGRGPYKGFSSITITARRVGPPASTLVWDTVRDPLCPKCRAKNVPHQGPRALAAAAHQCQASGHFAYSDFPSNGSMVRLKMREPHTGLYAGQEYWVTRMDEKEDSLSPDTPPSGKSSLMFSSCVHFQVSQQCPNAIYYLDKSLSVPLEQPQTASPQMHRSVLSLNLRCSSHRLTADGVDSIANREPINRAQKPELLKGRQDLQGPCWSPVSQGNHWKESPALKPVHLGSGTCPWTGSPSLENAQFVDGGSNQVTVRKEKEDHVACPTSRRADQLSIHIPGWSYRADYMCCDLVVKLQECKKREDPDTTPEPLPAPTSPAVSEEPQSSDLLEDRPEPQHPLASFMTLQEALEVHKPQFISRSQERLKKLKQMVQQRQTQQKEGQKQSPLPVRANRKQFTVPHPLSDNLFKPKERCISEKEMHMRSKRIYNNLPEVKKKKEEQKKRIILQSNRLRAEVFKKQLLDQLLQRNAV